MKVLTDQMEAVKIAAVEKFKVSTITTRNTSLLVWEPRPLTNKGLNMILKNGYLHCFPSNH